MLREYTKADFKWLEQWVTDEDLLFRFSGPDWQFPLTPEQLEPQLARYPDRIFYMGCDEQDVPYAFGQLIMNEANAPRIGRLLVGDPAKRGKGLGQQFVKELIDACKKLDPSEYIYLFVEEHNAIAIHCYQKAGFQFTDDAPFYLQRGEQKQKIMKMALRMR